MAPSPVLRGPLAPCHAHAGLGAAREQGWASPALLPCQPRARGQAQLRLHGRDEIFPQRPGFSCLHREQPPRRCEERVRDCAVRAQSTASEAASADVPSLALQPGRMVFLVNPKGTQGAFLVHHWYHPESPLNSLFNMPHWKWNFKAWGTSATTSLKTLWMIRIRQQIRIQDSAVPAGIGLAVGSWSESRMP